METRTLLRLYCLLTLFIGSSLQLLFSQCSAGFTYTLGVNGTASFVSTSTGTTTNTQHTWYLASPNNNTTGVATTTFANNQIYTIVLFLNDLSASPSCSAVTLQTVGIGNAPCTGSLSFNTYTTQSGSTKFISYDIPYGYTYTYAFGDGSISNFGINGNPVNTFHTYTTSGIYTVTLTAISYSGTCTYSAVNTITLSNITPCNLIPSFSYTSGANGQVTFSSTSVGTNSNSGYEWKFRDGSSTVYNTPFTSHTFSNNAVYPVMLKVGNNQCADSIIQPVSVTSVSCSATTSFALQKDTLQPLNWFVIPTYPSNVSAVQWVWGDGTTTNSFYPSHTYASAYYYNICVNVTVTCGNTYNYCLYSYLNKPLKNAEIESMVNVNVIKPANNVGLGEINASLNPKLSIWPNPNNAEFNLSIKGISKNKSIIVRISNILGETVYEEILKSESESFDRHFQMNNTSQGTYFISLISENVHSNLKLIIVK